MISDFFSSPNEHIEKLTAVDVKEGDPSVQNGLELAINNFSEVPKYAFKEVLIIYSSMITCDPNNIFETIESLKDNGIKVGTSNW